MEENEKLYKFGVNGYDWLRIRGSSYIDSSLLFWGAYRIIECDINGIYDYMDEVYNTIDEYNEFIEE